MQRATWVWFGLHLILVGATTAMGEPAVEAMIISLPTLWIWVCTAFAVGAISRLRGEALILANLGISGTATASVVVGWCVLLDVALTTAAVTFR